MYLKQEKMLAYKRTYIHTTLLHHQSSKNSILTTSYPFSWKPPPPPPSLTTISTPQWPSKWEGASTSLTISWLKPTITILSPLTLISLSFLQPSLTSPPLPQWQTTPRGSPLCCTARRPPWWLAWTLPLPGTPSPPTTCSTTRRYQIQFFQVPASVLSVTSFSPLRNLFWALWGLLD